MKCPLADASSKDIVSALDRIESGIRDIPLPTRDSCYAPTAAVDQLATLVAHEQILADELRRRRTATRQIVAWYKRDKLVPASVRRNVLLPANDRTRR